MILPMIHNGIAVVIGTSRSFDTISPPRSYRIGTIDMINTTASFDTYLPKVTAKAAANFSIIPSMPKHFCKVIRKNLPDTCTRC